MTVARSGRLCRAATALRAGVRRHGAAAVIVALVVQASAATEPPVRPASVPPELVVVHDSANLFIHERLERVHASLSRRCEAWNLRAAAFNAHYGRQEFDVGSPEAIAGEAEHSWLTQEAEDYADAMAVFAIDLPKLDIDEALYIGRIEAMGNASGFSSEESARLHRSLNGLFLPGGSEEVGIDRAGIWRDIAANDASDELAREAAASAVGPVLSPPAGTQSFSDCALFALANATGQPYGVITARANQMLADADWRAADDRADTVRAIETTGISGGEMVLLAESFGNTAVVARAAIPRALGDGQAVLVCLAAADAGGGRHQVVLTRAFAHGDETWFELIDSTLPAGRRRYLSDRQLSQLMTENGVAVGPDPDRVPRIDR